MKDTKDPILSVIASLHESEHVQISISDNGAGISKEVIGCIYLPFYSTRVTNSGIGLSLSQQIMILHNRRLEVSSELMAGATFRMIF